MTLFHVVCDAIEDRLEIVESTSWLHRAVSQSVGDAFFGAKLVLFRQLRNIFAV